MNLVESIFGWALTLSTIFGNGHVCYLIILRPQLHTTANWFVLSLAVADTLVGACYFPVLYFCTSWPVQCTKEFLQAFQWTLLFLSTSNLCTMSLDRYLAIVKPLKYINFMTDKRVICLLSLAWSLPILSYTVPYVVIHTGHNAEAERYFVYYPFIVLQITPCVALLVVFVRVCVTVRKQARRTAAQVAQVGFNHTVRLPSNHSARRSSVRWFGILLAIFITSHVVNDLASGCSRATTAFCSHASWSVMKKLGPILIMANSAINPLVYGLLKQDIGNSMRKSFVSMLSAIGI